MSVSQVCERKGFQIYAFLGDWVSTKQNPGAEQMAVYQVPGTIISICLGDKTDRACYIRVNKALFFVCLFVLLISFGKSHLASVGGLLSLCLFTFLEAYILWKQLSALCFCSMPGALSSCLPILGCFCPKPF